MDAFMGDLISHDPKRVIWIDDDLWPFVQQAENLLDPFGIDKDNRLFIAPDTRIGLTRDHISAIIEFVDNN